MKKRKARRVALIEEPENRILYSAGFGYQVPPDFDLICIYFSQKGCAEIAGNFYQHFHNLGWLPKQGLLSKIGRCSLPTGYSTIHNQ